MELNKLKKINTQFQMIIQNKINNRKNKKIN